MFVPFIAGSSLVAETSNARTALSGTNRPAKRTFRGRDYTLKRAIALIRKLKTDYSALQRQVRARAQGPEAVSQVHSQQVIFQSSFSASAVPLAQSAAPLDLRQHADLPGRWPVVFQAESAGQRHSNAEMKGFASAALCSSVANPQIVGSDAGIQLVFTEPNQVPQSSTDYRWMHDWNEVTSATAGQPPASVFHADSCQCPFHAAASSNFVGFAAQNSAPSCIYAHGYERQNGSTVTPWTYAGALSRCESIASSACTSVFPSPVPSVLDSSLSLYSNMLDESPTSSIPRDRQLQTQNFTWPLQTFSTPYSSSVVVDALRWPAYNLPAHASTGSAATQASIGYGGN